MLNINWIRKDMVHGSEEWHMGRLAKLTSSEWHRFMGEKPFTTGAMSYIYDKCGEDATGIPAKDEVSTNATLWGQEYEQDNLLRFKAEKKVEFLVTQRLISEPESRFGSTPDGIWVIRKSEDQMHYQVETVEAKCPPSYSAFVKLVLCKNLEEVKAVAPAYYHQVLHQMQICGALKGYLSIFHPKFRYGNFKIFEFRKIELANDFKLLVQRMKMAEDKFIETREKLFNLQPQ